MRDVQPSKRLHVGFLLKDGQASDKTVYARAKILIVYTFLTRVHGDEGISDDILQERAGVYGAHDEA